MWDHKLGALAPAVGDWAIGVRAKPLGHVARVSAVAARLAPREPLRGTMGQTSKGVKMRDEDTVLKLVDENSCIHF
jgi:hypothetical protein